MKKRIQGVVPAAIGAGALAADGWREANKRVKVERVRVSLLAQVGYSPGWLAVWGPNLFWVIGTHVCMAAKDEQFRCLRMTGGHNDRIEYHSFSELAAVPSRETALACLALATAGLDGNLLIGLSELQLSVVARVMADALWF